MPIPAHAPLMAAMTGLGIVVVYDCKRPPVADCAPAFDPPADERPIDLLVGGTPCQSFSVAGLRKGLDDPRGNLMLTFLSIAPELVPKSTEKLLRQ